MNKFILCVFLVSICNMLLASASDPTGIKSGLRITTSNDDNRYCNFIVKSPIQTTLNTKFRLVSSVNTFTDTISGANPITGSGNLRSENMVEDLETVEYEGTDCDCTLRFWSEEDFKGEYYSYTLKNTNSGTFTLSERWVNKVQSFKFYYN